MLPFKIKWCVDIITTAMKGIITKINNVLKYTYNVVKISFFFGIDVRKIMTKHTQVKIFVAFTKIKK